MSEYIHIMHKYTLVDIWKCTSMQMQQSKFVLGQMKSPANRNSSWPNIIGRHLCPARAARTAPRDCRFAVPRFNAINKDAIRKVSGVAHAQQLEYYITSLDLYKRVHINSLVNHNSI